MEIILIITDFWHNFSRYLSLDEKSLPLQERKKGKFLSMDKIKIHVLRTGEVRVSPPWQRTIPRLCRMSLNCKS